MHALGEHMFCNESNDVLFQHFHYEVTHPLQHLHQCRITRKHKAPMPGEQAWREGEVSGIGLKPACNMLSLGLVQGSRRGCEGNFRLVWMICVAEQRWLNLVITVDHALVNVSPKALLFSKQSLFAWVWVNFLKFPQNVSLTSMV